MTIILIVVIILVGIIIMQSRNTQDGSIKNNSVATIITNWLTFLSSPGRGDELVVATERPLPLQPQDELSALPPDPLSSQPRDELPSLPLDPLPSQPRDELPSLPLDPLPSQPRDELPSPPMDTTQMPRTQVTNYPEQWGPKPAIETKDITELPGDYGYGSSTIKAWIEYNMKRDKKRENLKSAKSYEFMCMVDVMLEAIERGILTNEFVEKHRDILEVITSTGMETSTGIEKLQNIDHTSISTFVDGLKGEVGTELFDIMVDVSEKYPDSLCKKELERVIMSHTDENTISNQMPVINIVEDDSITTEDKVIRITKELSEQVPDISEDDMVDIVNIVVEGETSLQNESDISSEDIIQPEITSPGSKDPELLDDSIMPILEPGVNTPPPPVDDDLTSALNSDQTSVINIVEDDSITTEDKVIQITEELSEQVPDISEDDMVDIVNIVVEGETSLQNESDISSEDNIQPEITSPGSEDPESPGSEDPESSDDLQQFHSKLENGFLSSFSE